jgi:hypothetical protein
MKLTKYIVHLSIYKSVGVRKYKTITKRVEIYATDIVRACEDAIQQFKQKNSNYINVSVSMVWPEYIKK